MSKILVLGAGMVARPLIRYLLEESTHQLTVTSLDLDEANRLVDGHAQATTLRVDISKEDEVSALIAEHDLSVSLLPAPFHPLVARLCLAHGKHMVTASYVSDEMRSLHDAAAQKGLLFLNEVGVDPGLDHMSAMRVIDSIRDRGGKLTSFRSYCGGIPPADARDNPFSYKFSWSPRAVCTAGKNVAVFRKDGTDITIPARDIFLDPESLVVEGLGNLEAYPNRDSLAYLQTYGVEDIQTMLRGTLRWPGWCETLFVIGIMDYLSEEIFTPNFEMSYAELTAKLTSLQVGDDLRIRLAEKLELAEDGEVMQRLAWLGLFSIEALPEAGGETTALDVLANLMARKMPYGPGEKDLLVMQHVFEAEFEDGSKEEHISTLVKPGYQPDGDSAMARTVGLPTAICARLILDGKISTRGVKIPIEPEIYLPVLKELESFGIHFVENMRLI